MGVSVLSHIALATQLGLGIVFLLSALPKLRRPLTFVHSVVEYRILPAGMAYVFGLALIPLEIFLALAFLTGWRTNLALPVTTLMLIAFLVAVGVNLRRGRQIPCGCFGNVSERISPRTLARLLLLLAGVLFLIVVRSFGDASSLPRLGSLAVDVSTFIYLLQTASLAGFMLLLAAWLLAWPELLLVVRQLRQPVATDNPRDAIEVEGA